MAPSFLYSFEHVGQIAGRGSHFLSGLPIVANFQLPGDERNEHAAHGDELAFLFDTRDLYGQAIQGAEVREWFTKIMISRSSLQIQSHFFCR